MLSALLSIAFSQAPVADPAVVLFEADARDGAAVIVRGTVRRLPPIDGAAPIGLTLDDGTPVYVGAQWAPVGVQEKLIGQYVEVSGTVTKKVPLTVATSKAFQLRKRALEPLEGKLVWLEGRVTRDLAVLIVDRHLVRLAGAVPRDLSWKHAVVKGTLRRAPDGKMFELEVREVTPSERKD